MTRAGERKIAKKEQVNGGAGHVLMEALLNEEERGEHCRIFSQVTIEPGCELGYHEHHGETETYYVLSGSATYMDNDKEYDRLGLEDQYTELLGNQVVCHCIPVRPGRNLAVIVETASINHRQKMMGYNAAKELYRRVQENLTKGR